ncbi:hypothetical protein M433DRAFT_158001 [Acidomyces richmondensis BFW]|nr:MAG: hypothetical protein FE78DRAFT_84851 [Acidomyces sp. 'richmondensis']KYG42348.1 hypothetical protein M433DRAFT_158001 [Acidomyces richmondensis BFW]
MSAKSSSPTSMRAWQYITNSGPLEHRIQLNTVPLPKTKADEHLIKVTHAALNPVDFKPAEVWLISRFIIPKPATPGVDFAGYIVQPAAGSSLKPGQAVFGASSENAMAGGALREYANCASKGVVPLPDGVDAEDASGLTVTGLTAYQSIVPYVKAGDKVFINGGSGGVGVLGVQIAKVLGCRVTATCSTANVDLVQSLGADAVIDYKTCDVLQSLRSQGPFDHVVDNVGDFALYFHAHEYTKPDARFVFVGATPSMGMVLNMLRGLLPGFLGGGRRKFTSIFAQVRAEELKQIATWMREGRVRQVIDSKWAFEDTKKAFERSKTGRARGKIVVHVAAEEKTQE